MSECTHNVMCNRNCIHIDNRCCFPTMVVCTLALSLGPFLFLHVRKGPGHKALLCTMSCPSPVDKENMKDKLIMVKARLSNNILWFVCTHSDACDH